MRNAYEGRSNGRTFARGYEDRDETRFRERFLDDEREMYSQQGRGRSRDTVGHANMVKVIEVLAESERSWEDAAQIALREASRSIRNIRSIYVKDMQAVCRDGQIVSYRINAKISFALETGEDRRFGGEDRYGRY